MKNTPPFLREAGCLKLFDVAYRELWFDPDFRLIVDGFPVNAVLFK